MASRVRWFVAGFVAGVAALYSAAYTVVVRYFLFGKR